MACMRRGGAIFALLAALSVLAAGCGSEGDSSAPKLDTVLEQVDGLTGDARLAKLAELAKAEGGSLSLYTSISGSVVEDIVSAFEDEYDVDVALYRASSEITEQRVLEEADAGFHGADVVDTAGQSMISFSGKGLLADYPFDSASLIDGAVHEGWAATRLQRFVVAWNAKKAERPASWEALGDPEWKGRLLIEAGDWDWYSRLWTYWVEEQGLSAAQADGRFERILRNAKVIKGHSLGAQLLAAGEADAFAAAYAHHIDNLAKDGAPVAWTPAVEPVILRQNGVGVLEGAQHPAAAALFVEWALGPGQEAYAASGYRSPRRDAKEPDGEFRQIDEERLARERDRWIKAWERLIALGEAGPTG
jgi:iron(III) transport system substrate-binding protein